MTKELPSPELLRKLLRYEPDTGKLFWMPRSGEFFDPKGKRSSEGCAANWNARYAHKEAFTALDGWGYFMGRIFNKPYKAHRVAWCILHGSWPKNQIDHKNGIRTDNRICNLRDVNQSENSRNSKKRSDNTSGAAGVCFDKARGQWTVRICNKQYGRFDDLSDATRLRRSIEMKHGFTERHGR